MKKIEFEDIDWLRCTQGEKVLWYHYFQYGGVTVNRQTLYKVQHVLRSTWKFRHMRTPETAQETSEPPAWDMLD